ncbi:LexA family transcriptional regulator [Staphylothermus hellenicus]|uniref:Transcriptional regulator, TrmB n=1 Tax=Staphylothermus hellenicus (strain DSM 12710 / JCM 10830 / BK20S6-10-b1 / P8) TaxID=591019 RepID=D7D8P6_STAHD|nr:LexA family transcriptional regulator [Staphylothermus hellenicus]ADI32142.1 transcriptional regulator, TrmB [Staphylothermus hellenicus DSM 12710]
MLRKARQVSMKHRDPLIELSGSSLDVYMLLLRHKEPLSIREIQRMMGFKSPNSVRHHLERLSSLGFVEKTRYGYVAVKPRGSILDLIFEFKGLVVPRQFFTLLVTIFLTIGYVILFSNMINVYVLSSFIAINILLLNDTLKIYNRLKNIIKHYRSRQHLRN